MDPFTITTETYQGPLELLIALIESRKLSINDFSLASVADEFLEYLNQLDEYNPRVVTQFISVASTLVLIKARSLIPDIPITDEESQDIADLEFRLKRLEILRQAGRALESVWGNVLTVGRPQTLPTTTVFRPTMQVNVERLLDLAHDILHRHAQAQQESQSDQELPNIHVSAMMKLEDVMSRITQRLSAGNVRLSELIAGAPPGAARPLFVLSFLALLDMVRTGVVHLEQSDVYGELVVSTV